MITVYRIEGPDGNGLFRSYKGKDGIIRNHSNYSEIAKRHYGEEFPNPLDDVVISKVKWKGRFFAYNTKYKVNQAITPREMKECTRMGFKVYELKIKEKGYTQSIYQTVFKKEAIASKIDITKEFI